MQEILNEQNIFYEAYSRLQQSSLESADWQVYYQALINEPNYKLNCFKFSVLPLIHEFPLLEYRVDELVGEFIRLATQNPDSSDIILTYYIYNGPIDQLPLHASVNLVNTQCSIEIEKEGAIPTIVKTDEVNNFYNKMFFNKVEIRMVSLDKIRDYVATLLI